MLLSKFLAPFVRSGELTVVDPRGARTHFGRRDDATPADEPRVVIRIADRMTGFKLGLNPGLYAGEAYMDGTLTIESGTIYDLLALVTRNMGIAVQGGAFDKWRHRLGPILRAVAAAQLAGARAAERGASLRSVARSLSPLPRSRHAVFLRVFRTPRYDARRRAKPPRRITSPRSCCCATASACSISAAAGAVWRLPSRVKRGSTCWA